MECDICQRELTDTEAVTVAPEAVADAAERGFVPTAAPALGQVAEASGLSLHDAWRQIVEANRGQAWTLCAVCRDALREGSEAPSRERSTLCWFCDHREVDPDWAAEQVLHAEGNAHRDAVLQAARNLAMRGLSGRLLLPEGRYTQMTVRVPRCKPCAWAHDLPFYIKALMVITGGVLLLAVLILVIATARKPWDYGALIAAAVFGAVGGLGVVGMLALCRTLRRLSGDARDPTDLSAHPKVRELRRQGWRLGRSPSPSETVTIAEWTTCLGM